MLGEPQLLRVEIVDRAVVPVRPAHPNRPLNLFIGAIIGVVLGLAVSVATFLWLYLRARYRPDRDPRSQEHLRSEATGKKPWLAFGVVFTFAGTLLTALLGELLLGYMLGKWIIGMLLLLAGATAGLTFLLRRFANPELQRTGFNLAAWLAFLTALPVIGFAAFFLFALTQESGGLNPAVDEAVIVPLIWLGAFILPICGLRLWQARKRSPLPDAERAVRSDWGWRQVVGVAALVMLLGVLAAGVLGSGYFWLRQSPVSVVQSDTLLEQPRSFGPVIERELPITPSGSVPGAWLNPESGIVSNPVQGLWESNQVPAIALLEMPPNRLFQSLGLRCLADYDEASFDHATAMGVETYARSAVSSLAAERARMMPQPSSDGGWLLREPLPASYVFVTRSGVTGLLEATSLTADRRGVKIRYKLVQGTADLTQPDAGKPAVSTTKLSELQFRWVANEGETNAPADLLSDPSDRTGKHKLRVLKEVVMDGSTLAKAGLQPGRIGHAEIVFTWTDSGRRRFAELTTANVGRQLAIVYEGKVLTAPIIASPIDSATGQIAGIWQDAEAERIVRGLNPAQANGDELRFSDTYEFVLPQQARSARESVFLALASRRWMTNPIPTSDSREFHQWIRQQGADITGGSDLREFHDWLRKNNPAAAATEPEPLPLAFCHDAVVVPAATNAWESATPTAVQYRWELMTQEAEKETVVGRREGAPDTLYFRTRDNVCGLLQVVGFTDNPRGVKLRYKLVQNAGGEN